MSEPLSPLEQPHQETGAALASEGGHWYDKNGNPVYEVPRAKGDGTRPTTLGDARKLDLRPSVTNVLNVAAKPGLETWKTQQILQSALTLPRVDGETLDAYALRVIEDSKAQSQKARDKGTELHAAIEQYIRCENFDEAWRDHIDLVSGTLFRMGMPLRTGKAEHSFASPLGYGGKIDWHNLAEFEAHEGGNHQISDDLIIDFKTKERIDDKKPLAWPEHVQQLAAYGFGIFGNYLLGVIPITSETTKFRAINVFIGVEDKQVRVIEHEWPDIVEAFAQFRCLLEFWQRTKKFGPYAKKK